MEHKFTNKKNLSILEHITAFSAGFFLTAMIGLISLKLFSDIWGIILCFVLNIGVLWLTKTKTKDQKTTKALFYGQITCLVILAVILILGATLLIGLGNSILSK